MIVIMGKKLRSSLEERMMNYATNYIPTPLEFGKMQQHSISFGANQKALETCSQLQQICPQHSTNSS